MSDIPPTATRVAATYGDLEHARSAVEALEEQGIDAGRIRLEGPLAAAADRASIRRDNRGRDDVLLGKITRVIVSGAIGGSVVGLLLGVLAAVAVWGPEVLGPPPGPGLWAFAIGLAAAGAGVGLAATSYKRMKQSEAWEQTYEPMGGGPVSVAVYTDESSEVTLAQAVLRERGGRQAEVQPPARRLRG
jgi:hypothetical protein